MKKIIFTIAMLAFASLSNATIIIVDINGAGQFTSIQLAIDNALPGDTIQVWPGTYNGAININKNVVLQGSGYENTIITSASNPTINMSNGKIKWFQISSTGGTGILLSSGTVLNCVVKACASTGLASGPGTGYVYNSIFIQNGGWGATCEIGTGYLFVWNCISRNNAAGGFNGDAPGYGCDNLMNLSFSNGTRNCTGNNQGCIDADPIFTSLTNYHLSTGSPCFDTGQPSLSDPDGSISDMGYFGGPDCPIFPVVYQMTVSPNGNNINVQAKARANY